jgi:hypothetical protein
VTVIFEEDIVAFTVTLTLKSRHGTECARLSAPAQEVRTGNGLFIGLTKAAFLARMGRPHADTSGVLYYKRDEDRLQVDRPGTCAVYSRVKGQVAPAGESPAA